MKEMKSPYLIVLSARLVLVLNLCLGMTAIAQTNSSVDLTGSSLEDLMNMQVTSVSRKKQSLSKAGGAIYVISQDDIRHSGATNIPDLLRMVPGVEVARINANSWAISIRGFNSRYAGKVLVLLDGRTVYTPLFSGVYWDQQSVPLENVDRIEVIRGPGGTVWGANAMNGVINIITKSANETRGALISAVAGSQDRAQGLVQYGGTAGSKGAYRVYGRYTMSEDSHSFTGRPAVDHGHSAQMGFRSDWSLSPQDKLTVQGRAAGESEDQTITTLFSNRLSEYFTFNDKVKVGAGNVLGRWNHLFSNGSESTLQVYYDRFRRFDQGLNILNTGDVDYQYHFQAGARNDIVAGLDYRLTDQSFTDGYELSIGSGHRRDSLFSSFIQDEITLSKYLALTVGVKFEHNAYTGFENEPSVELVYVPNSRQTLWGSASRAIQQPSWLFAEAEVDQAIVPLPGGGSAVYHLSGNPNAAATTLLSYELGYRVELSRQLTVDATAFFSNYHQLQTLEPQTPFFAQNPPPPHLVLPNIFGNGGKATSHGVEVSARWNVTKWWRVSPGFSLLRLNVNVPPGSTDATSPGASPRQQAQLRSTVKLPHNIDWDTSAYYVGALTFGPVPAYTRLDTRLGWHIGEAVEVGVTGQNLLTPHHLEFLDGLQLVPMEAVRSVVAKVTVRF